MEINTDSINGAIKNYQQLDDGSLLCWITIGCTGELKYNEGSKNRIEVVNADTLYSDDSINTAIGRPIVLDHPPKPIISNLAERKRYEKGITLQEIVKSSEDGTDFLNISSLITDQSLIKMIMNGEISQISPCYRSEKEEINTDSVPKYLQKNRLYNHFAFCKEGRHGKKVKIYLSGVNCDSNGDETMNVKELVEMHLKYGDLMVAKGITPSYDWTALELKQNILKAINPNVDSTTLDEVNCDSVLAFAGESVLEKFKAETQAPPKTEPKTEPKDEPKLDPKPEPKEEPKKEPESKSDPKVPDVNKDSVDPVFSAEKRFIEIVEKRNTVTK